ncbi:MAG: tRNA epoxyqueuosine(34) reductase QueG [FCB group bacterium]|jgi:epoxyqueuosine reductase|nr:tRNA epoxyqueuosine(34) reductase QueG [FCB group bacterium]
MSNELQITRANAVKAHAKLLGFDACGIAEAGDVDPGDRLAQWLARGYHAGMAWMAATRELRRDIRRKLPGARSVVVVARNYYAPQPESETGIAKVARYAWGRDYHRVLRKPLRALEAFLAELEPGAQSEAFVDSGPVMEKAWAARAGIGWIGKNSLVLRRDLGSWFFLGVVATTLELAPDAPAHDRCGSCTACLDACPTQAIVEPRVVDSNRCIAYHTIENRNDIPEDLQPAFGDWAFGCDICQDVCPWNRRPLTTSEADFLPRAGRTALDPDEAGAWDDVRFLQRFAGSPLMRAKRLGLTRNLRIVKQNQPRR